jgi:hypothetical protein
MSTRQEDLVKEGKEQAHHLTDTAKDAAATAQAALHDGKEKAAAVADQAAHVIRDQSEKAGVAGDTLASGIEKTSEYVRETDTPAMANDIEAFIKKHPMQTVAAMVGAYIVLRYVL